MLVLWYIVTSDFDIPLHAACCLYYGCSRLNIFLLGAPQECLNSEHCKELFYFWNMQGAYFLIKRNKFLQTNPKKIKGEGKRETLKTKKPKPILDSTFGDQPL